MTPPFQNGQTSEPQAPNDDLRPWLTQADLARHWRLSGRTLARWRAEGYGPPWAVLGGSVRYRREDVRAFEAAHQRDR